MIAIAYCIACAKAGREPDPATVMVLAVVDAGIVIILVIGFLS